MWGTGMRGLMRNMATPQGNQELSVFRDKVGKSPGELGVSKSRQCDIYPLKCFDTVGWMTIRASGHKCWVSICRWWFIVLILFLDLRSSGAQNLYVWTHIPSPTNQFVTAAQQRCLRLEYTKPTMIFVVLSSRLRTIVIVHLDQAN